MSDIVERLHERIGVAHSHYISPDIRLLMDAIDALESLRAENERMREALTPSAETKGAYIGEFKFNTPIVNSKGQEEAFMTYVPWPTIKEIMAAIRARAALTPKGE